MITAYATLARPNTQYRLMMAPALATGEGCPDTNKVAINANVRVSSSSGVIGNTSGGVTGAPGDYHVCFYELGTISSSATAPVFFTVI